MGRNCLCISQIKRRIVSAFHTMYKSHVGAENKIGRGITDATYLSEVTSKGKAAFRKLIQNERRIEFAFEDHRFWDLRRCLLPLDTTIEGIQVTRTDNGLSYEIKEIEQRPLDALRYYYLPLPNDELLKNPNLKNNMGWNNN